MKVVILGSGNLGTQLRYALLDAGHEILQVWHRNEKIVAGADVYIICVKDDAINIVFNQIEHKVLLKCSIIHQNVCSQKKNSDFS